MSDSKELALTGGQVPLFAGFINLEVALSFPGACKVKLEDLEKEWAGDPLVEGTEVVIVSRYFVKEVHKPVHRKEVTNDGRTWQERHDHPVYAYELAGAKVDLGFLEILSIQAKKGVVHQTIAAPCSCLVEKVAGEKQPQGFKAASYPLTRFWAAAKCPICEGRGYVFPRKNKAPRSEEIRGSYGDLIVLVDKLPETPDIPEGGCPECGAYGHHIWWECREKERKKAEKKAGKQQSKAAEPIGSASPSISTPECYGQKGAPVGPNDCRDCELSDACGRLGDDASEDGEE
jgi:hypothetical protein